MSGTFDYTDRLGRLRSEMSRHEVDVALLSVGSDLPWLTGYAAMPSERLIMAVIPLDGDVRLVIPELEAPRVHVPGELFEVVPWSETDDPVAIVGGYVSRFQRGAIGDQTWARFVVALQAEAPNLALSTASPMMSKLRLRKDPAEIELLRRSAAAADSVSTALAGETFSGRTERELAQSIAEATVAAGCDHAKFAIVASGPNAASPHHHPDGREIGRGDTVVVDFGGTIDGYHSDTTRTFSVGEPSPDVVEAYRVLEAAQRTGREAATVGTTAERVDAATRAVIEDAGYGDYFIHRTGHGIGLDVHEDPYLVSGNTQPLEAGMAFSVEPGIYVPDQWGMRIEDIVVATEHGPEVLNNTSRSLVVVG